MKKLPRAKIFGHQVIELGITESTNSHASHLMIDTTPAEGTAIRANYQHGGRGQGEAEWESESGKNLLVSFILYPDFLEAKDLYLLSETIALGIHDFLTLILGEGVRIKWPNDIYFEDRKIAGILIENSIRDKHVNYSIVGIGLNVNQTKFSSNIPNPVSIRIINSVEEDLKSVLKILCDHLEIRYRHLKWKDYDRIKKDYLQSLYGYNEFLLFEVKGVQFRGKIENVTDDGKLVIQKEDARYEAFSFKEIKFVIYPGSD